MDPSIVVAGIALAGTLGTAIWKYMESKNTTDKVTGVEVSQRTLMETIGTLREEVERYRNSAAIAYREAQDAREEATQILEQYEAMRHALAATRVVVDEHQQTIDRQQREIASLRSELAKIRGSE